MSDFGETAFGPFECEFGLDVTQLSVFLWGVWGRTQDDERILIGGFRFEEDAEAFARASNGSPDA